jgi:hypothetical protein
MEDRKPYPYRHFLEFKGKEPQPFALIKRPRVITAQERKPSSLSTRTEQATFTKINLDYAQNQQEVSP